MAWIRSATLGDDRHDAARLARILWIVSGLIVLATEWMLPNSVDRPLLAMFGVSAIVLGLLAPLFPWRRWPKQTLLVMIIIGQVMIGLAGVVVPGATGRYVVLYAVSYLYIGLTEPPGAAFRFVPLTIVTCVAGMGTALATAWFDFILVVTVAVLIAETLARNIQRERRAEDAVRHLLESARRFARLYSVQEAALCLTDVMRETLGADLVAVLLQDDHDPNLYVEVSGNSSVAEFGPMIVNVATEQTGVAVAVHSGQIVFVADAPNSPIPSRRLVEATGLLSVIYVPLMGHQRCLGAVVAGWRHHVQSLDPLDQQTVEVLSAEAGLVLERLQENARLAWDAEREPLTGLANRRSFTRALNESTARDAIVMIDLDGFKAVNDRYGHAIGDDVLLAMADCLQRSTRELDCVSRFGGDEFAVVLHQGGQPAADAMLRRLADAWRETDPLVAYSSGVAVRVADELPERAFERADVALYASKAENQTSLVIDQL